MFDLTARVYEMMGLYVPKSERPAIDNSLLRGSEIEQEESFETVRDMLEAGGHCTCGAHSEEVVDGECMSCGKINV
ncbi:MAG: hypothetical protein DDT23_00364 [candidate division WS2 bacterium]|nr:hypothetical protein [Candidatus Lithacetigena glycinireducens]